MKIKGFTLAEVLIALGIIGTIAAMTIPQFTANVHNQAFASKLSAVVSDYENVFGMMLLKEDKDQLGLTEFGHTANSAVEVKKTALAKYTKFIDYVSHSGLTGTPKQARNINGGSTNIRYNWALTTSNGAVIYGRFHQNLVYTPNNINIVATLLNSIKENFLMSPAFAVPSTTLYADVYVDVNGDSPPNMYGRDIFAFAIGEDGIFYPFGTADASYMIRERYNIGSPTATWHSNDEQYGCSTGTYNGLGCTARLIENNYKMDY
jgi:prepilin-type N-terminal cleavage/methylation domain-containing protein